MALDKAGLEAKFKAIAGAYEIKGGSDVYFGLSDVKRELGITQADKQYATRLLALTDPGAYYTQRKRAFDLMSEEVEIAYQKSFVDYAGSGLSNEEAKKYALKAAGTIRDAKMDVIEMNYPTGANSVGASSLARKVGNEKFSGSLGGKAPPRRRAPARRKR
jgi:hypothetical protein